MILGAPTLLMEKGGVPAPKHETEFVQAETPTLRVAMVECHTSNQLHPRLR